MAPRRRHSRATAPAATPAKPAIPKHFVSSGKPVGQRRVSEFREVVGKVVALLSQRDIRVTQEGTQASVRYNQTTLLPEVINLPYISEDADEELLGAVRGFLDHEVAHVLETDAAVMNDPRFIDPNTGKRNPILHNVFNIIEDTRIEKKMQKRFPGSAANLNGVMRFMAERFTKPSLTEALAVADKAQVFSVLAVPLFRAWSGQHIAREIMDEVDGWNLLEDAIGVLGKFEDDVRNCDTCMDALEVSLKIYDALKTPPKKEEPKDDKKGDEGEGDSSGDASDEKGEEDESSSSGKEEAKKEKKEEKPKKSEPKKEEKPSEEEGSEEGEGSGDGEDEEEGEKEEGEKEEEDKNEAESSDEDSDEGEKEQPKKKEKSKKEEKPSEDDGDKPSDDGESNGEEGSDAEEGDNESEGSGEGDGEEEGDEDDTEDGKSDGGISDGGSSSEDDESEADADEGSSEEDEDDGVPHEVRQVINEIEAGLMNADPDKLAEVLSVMSNYGAAKASYLPFTTDNDGWHDVPLNPSDINIYDRRFAEWDAETRHMSGQMQTHLRRMFAQQASSVNVGGKRSGRLQSSALHRLAAGDNRVFYHREEHQALDTAVTLAIDCSGSMSGTKIATACKAAYVLSQTLERLSIAHSIAGFTTHQEEDYYYGTGEFVNKVREAQDKAGRAFTRFEPIKIYKFKEFNQPFNAQVKRNLTAVGGDPDTYGSSSAELANNIDGESIAMISRPLLARREPRKIMIVLSDGNPACAGNNAELAEHLELTVKNLERSGIEMVGIGINSTAVHNFYKKCSVVKDIKELPNEVMGELKRFLIDNKRVI